MPIPGFQDFMLPTLRLAADREQHRQRDVAARLAEECHLSAEERGELLAGGGNRLNNRVGWALTYLAKAGLLDRDRGRFRITTEGQNVLKDPPARIDIGFLRRYPSFLDWGRASAGAAPEASASTAEPSGAAEDPDEAMERLWRERRQLVASELLERIGHASPAFFEQLVVRLLVAMGYGGTYAEASQVVGRSGDEGIDGMIKEDRLGLDAIYVQAKRWQSVVGRPEIQKFAGSLDGARARKGVFITTSGFSPDARAYVDRIDKRIVLIDGPQLADLMIEHGVGVATERTFAISRVDVDFFEEA
jgi:restriction system protein